MADPQDGAAVAIVGYPLDGNLTAIPGRVGRTANAFTQDALRQSGRSCARSPPLRDASTKAIPAAR